MAGPLTQVLDLQDLVVARGDLHASRAHDVARGEVRPDGTVWIHCSCGRSESSPTEPASKVRYAMHVAQALGFRLVRTERTR